MKRAATAASAVLVMRPEAPGRLLAAQIRAQGIAALWWPAFDLLPPEDPAIVEATLQRLVGSGAGAKSGYDVVVFVSPAAVDAIASAWQRTVPSASWPQGTVLAAMGISTAELARRALPGASSARVLEPPGDSAADGGSERLWEILRTMHPLPRGVLIVRAQNGRSWLKEQLVAAGTSVDELMAYQRAMHRPGPVETAALQALLDAGTRLVPLVSSTEAVTVLDAHRAQNAALDRALRHAPALCIHARIAQALGDAGYRPVQICEPEARSVADAMAAGIP